ncbi:MAG: D-alanyl-D-alanine carboxypeptidase/D-alanyl-D-alanine-endopeptidase [Gemmatimonadota bacterium]|jgi:D-alanyl-D-alanine carboxypeptidase/D-alanyl-D-alanine-endopeptidase (penicillin-binding protein 4)
MAKLLPCIRPPVPSLSGLALVGVLLATTSAGLMGQNVPDKRIRQVMGRPEFAHALWGMAFYDLDAKKTLFGVNPERLFVPGSTTKLLTVGTALELLGQDHRFHTRVYRTGPVEDGVVDGDLVLVAGGDPNLSGRERPDGTYAFIDHDHSYGGPPLDTDPLTVIRELARQVASHGIHTVTGQVLVDATLFREGDREGGTGVTMSPMVINDNVIDIVVKPGARAGDPAIVTVSPKTSYLTVFAHVVTADSGKAASLHTVEDSTDASHRTLVMSGSVPVGPALNRRWRVPVPSRFGEVVLVEALNEAGVRAIPRLGARRVDFAELAKGYADSLVVAEHISLPLSAEAPVVLKTSQNLHASNLPLLLGSLPAARDSAKTGFDLENAWLTGAGLNLDGAMQGDGAGAIAMFSPDFITHYLAVAAARPWGTVFHDALPILGTDGTLAEIQVGSPAAGQVHAKTGTYGVYDPLHRRLLITGKGLAGYMTTKSGRHVAFAIYLNHFEADVPDPATVAGQALGEISAIAWEVIR